jgi:CubicO group peptidase (beta-lactamase class C family)
MSRRTIVLAVLAHVVSGWTAGAVAQERSPELAVDSVFADLDLPTSPGCAVSVMRDGAIVYEQGYGMANLEYGVPITPRSVFHVASVSKQFTAMAVELLVNEGRVSWDDDIRKYVPEVPDLGTPITLRHLVHHVSGIRDQWNLLGMAGWRWEADVVTQGDVLDIISRQKALNFPPGERYLYSNTGFTLLAVVVERVSGQTLRQFTTERIFGPLGMETTHFHDDHEMIVRDRAWAYAPDPDGLYGLKNSIPDFDVVGATSLFTTVHDLAAWDRNFYTGRVGGKATIERMQQRFVLNSGDTSNYAHGLQIGRYRGLRTVSHGGADAGYRSHFLRFPDQRLSVAVLCNSPTSDPGGRANRVAAAYLGPEMAPIRVAEAPVKRPTVTQPRSALARLEGVYKGELPGQLQRILLVRDTLRVGSPRGAVLRPIGDDRFDVEGQNAIVTLRPPTNGQPATLELPGAGTLRRFDEWRPTTAELQSFAGLYHSDELGTDYRVELEENRLVVRTRKLEPMRLQPAFRDAFVIGGRQFEFTRTGNGEIDGFAISDGRVWNVRFERDRTPR